MLRRTFHGGVHPTPSKQLTAGLSIVELPLPDRVVLPLSQHLGAPARPLVKKGDRVERDQPIAEAAGHISAPLHTPIAGVVKAVEKRPHPAGFPCESVVVESTPPADGAAEVPAPPWRLADAAPDWQLAAPERLRALIRDAGIVGLGGAAFPTHAKLTPPAGTTIDTLIINGAECEPFLTCDHRVMLEQAEQVAQGVLILRRILGEPRVLVGVELNKADALAALRHALHGVAGVDVVGCQVKYPQGAEKQLCEVLTGRRVPPPPGLPLHVGVVVQNVATAAAVARAVIEGAPLTARVITVSGSLVQRPQNLRVAIGTSLARVVEACGGLRAPAAKVVMGGPMMGVALADLDVPVVKGTSGLLFFGARELPPGEVYPCIRCGRCALVCPLLLNPGELVARVECGDLDGARELHLQECMECGSCAYTCPSNRWLVQAVRSAKAQLHEREQRSSA